ncbi:MAG: hypothetical protein KAT05_07535 [Spirochaetes bacterium]|nr:hypothetical protein [Spirochaetota bacterium]
MNSKNDISPNDSEIIKSVNRSLELLKIGQFEEALKDFSIILKKHYSNSIAESGIKCCKYWISRLNKIIQINDNYEKGKKLFEEWKKFETFIHSIRNIQSKVISNIMFFVFNKALEAFKKDIRENRILDFQTSFMIALSYKKIGDFENAIKYFEETLSIENNNSNVIAQLADCYALIDQDKNAKILFREAFFIDPSSIEFELLDSNIITYLVSKILEMNISRKEINHWIPVYGRILGILMISRELIPIEVGKLRKEIFYLEKNLQDELVKDNIIKARLINCYLWLYDYIKLKKNHKEELGEIDYKIKNISKEIYDIFMKLRSVEVEKLRS